MAKLDLQDMINLQQQEVEINRILLGIITDPEDIKEYRNLYEKFSDEFKNKKFKHIQDYPSAQKMIKLFNKYGIEIWKVAKQSDCWQPLTTKIVKDGQVIAEFE